MGKSPHKRKTAVRVEFGKKVRLLRYQLGISQEKLAERSNLHTTYVSSVERGERNIALENIINISKGLSCSPKDLMPD